MYGFMFRGESDGWASCRAANAWSIIRRAAALRGGGIANMEMERGWRK
jgi:hypothetical protein